MGEGVNGMCGKGVGHLYLKTANRVGRTICGDLKQPMGWEEKGDGKQVDCGAEASISIEKRSHTLIISYTELESGRPCSFISDT